MPLRLRSRVGNGSPHRRSAVLLVVALALLLVGLLLSDGLASEPGTLVQQGPRLVGMGEDGEGRFGRSVALSADGDTALIGAPADGAEAGAAWVFTRSGTSWTEQGPKLTGPSEVGAGHFGRSVAMSADGNVALIGASNNDGGRGTAWVFTRSGSTWTEQAELQANEESGGAWFGRSVALSADGNTALVGGYVDHDDIGAAWVFTRVGSAWIQQGPKLTAGEESGRGEFGRSVALSGDGGTALIGGPLDGEDAGAAWVFTRSGSIWTQQGPKLAAGEESGPAEFGGSVALSAEGNTAAVGGLDDDEGLGAAWVFTRSGSTWAQQGPKLTGAGEIGAGLFGVDVALSPEGDEALIGGLADHNDVGAAWTFTRLGSTWTPDATKLTPAEESGKSQFGWSVSLAADGATALIGGLADEKDVGAAWVFAEPPVTVETTSTSQTTTSTSQTSTSTSQTTSTSTTTTSQSTTTGELFRLPEPTSVTDAASSTSALAANATGGVAAYHALGGRIVLVGRTIAVRRGLAIVRLRCVATVRCSGALGLTIQVRGRGRHAHRRNLTVGRTRFSIVASKTSVVELRLNAQGRSLLRSHRGLLSASMRVTKSSPGGVQTQRATVRLLLHAAQNSRRPKSRKSKA